MKRTVSERSSRSAAVWVIALCLAFTGVAAKRLEILKVQTTDADNRKPELVVQSGHESLVNFLLFSSDGKLIVSGDGRTTKLWDVATGRELRTLNELHTDYLIDYSRFNFSEDSKLIIDGLTILDVSTGKRVRAFQTAVPLPVSYESFLSDDNKIFASAGGGYVDVWNAGTGESLHSFGVSLATLNQKKILMASYGSAELLDKRQPRRPSNSNVSTDMPAPKQDDGAVHIYSLETGAEVRRFTGSATPPTRIVFSPDGKRLITAENNGFNVWDIDTGAKVASLAAEIKDLNSVEIGPASDVALYALEPAASRLTTFMLWNFASTAPVEIADERPREAGGMPPEVRFNPDGKVVAVSEFSGKPYAHGGISTLRLIDVVSGKDLRTINIGDVITRDGASTFAFAPGGQRIAIARDNEFEIRELVSGKIEQQFAGHANTPSVLSLANNGKTIAFSAINRSWIRASEHQQNDDEPATMIWSVADGRQPKMLEGELKYTGPYAGNGYAMMSSGGQLINYHNRYLTTFSVKLPGPYEDLTENQVTDATTYHIWDVETGEAADKLNRVINKRKTDKTSHIYGVEAGPEGSHVGIIVRRPAVKKQGQEPMMFELWNAETKRMMWDAEIPAPASGIHFDPDGKTVDGGGIRFFVTSGVPDLDEHGPSGKIEDMENYGAMSMDGIKIGTRIGSGRISLFKFGKPELIAELYWLSKDDWVVMTPDGRFDTNMDLDKIDGLHWVLPDDPLTPKPLELFMRQYYEPGLFSRLMKCVKGNDCETEFKKLPAIAEINRVQAKVGNPTGLAAVDK